jgi:hypothetical protein
VHFLFSSDLTLFLFLCIFPGAIPTSWSGLKALQRISVQNTNLTCATELDSAGRLACILPPFLAISESLNDDTIADVEYDCSLITIADEAYSTVTISSSYYHRSYCRCTEKYFGIAGVCRLCPAACDCTADRVKGCYPVTVAQPIDGWNSSASVLGPLTSTVSTPFIIPCPKSASGALLCNPSGLPWSSFYPNTSTENGGVGPAGVFSWSDPPDGFCSDGHTGRICSRCATGYFPSGRICLECASSGWNVLIIAANLLALLLLVTFLYIRSPSASTSRLQAAEYRVRSRTADDLPPSNQPASSVSASPLKLLIFHSQQLSILLQTMSSQPPVLSSFLSFTSSSSMGFSLSSLLALECFDHEWGIRERGWLSIVAMGGIVTVGGVIYIAGACTGGRKKRNLDDEEEDEEDGSSGYSAVYDSPDKPALPFTDMSLSSPSTLTSVSAGTTVASNRIYRVYGVCLSLLYFFLFPCLQTALSGLACTDSRQYHPSAPGGVGDYFYLNLNPWQACDSAWRSTILPPALIGTILWLVVFPVGSTILFRKMHHYLTHAGSQHTSVWPLCADLLAPYKPSLWYYEQLLLVRRILLVAAVTLIPSTSLYLPLVLFALVQVSAFIQHRYHPYASEWLNRGELISLYLLLINYITALLLQTGASASDAGSSVGGSINGWAIGLFVLNATFLLILIVGLFATMRTRMIALVQRCWPATAAPGKEEAASSAVHQASSAANGRVPLQAARKQELEEKQQPTRDRISKF